MILQSIALTITPQGHPPPFTFVNRSRHIHSIEFAQVIKHVINLLRAVLTFILYKETIFNHHFSTVFIATSHSFSVSMSYVISKTKYIQGKLVVSSCYKPKTSPLWKGWEEEEEYLPHETLNWEKLWCGFQSYLFFLID